MNLDIHPQALKNIDAKATGFLPKLVKMPPKENKGSSPTASTANLYAVDVDISMVKDMVMRSVDGFGTEYSRFFQTEDGMMAYDERNGAQSTIKEIDTQIKELRRAVRIAVNLPEKIEYRRKLQGLEQRRKQAWKEYDQSSGAIEKQKDTLIDEVEARMHQTIEEETLFTIHWTLI